MHGILALAAVIGIVCGIIEYIKEKREPVIPAENWANKDLKHEDIMNGVPMEQIIKYAQEGRYKLDENASKIRRDSNGNIIVDNKELYKEDIKNYGIHQTYEWVKQGKYDFESKDSDE